MADNNVYLQSLRDLRLDAGSILVDAILSTRKSPLLATLNSISGTALLVGSIACEDKLQQPLLASLRVCLICIQDSSSGIIFPKHTVLKNQRR